MPASAFPKFISPATAAYRPTPFWRRWACSRASRSSAPICWRRPRPHLALDWIASADVVRRYPDAIFVTVVEKRPFALWQSPVRAMEEAGVAVVERNGGVITSQDVEKFARLPKLVGAGAPEAAADLVDAVAAHRAIAARIAAYERMFRAALEPDPG